MGDATNVMAVQLLLDNTRHIGVHKALLVFSEVERMARESVEGQAIELAWIAEQEFDLTDRDYVRMAHKKTCWYTVIAPLRIGVLCGAPPGANFPGRRRSCPTRGDRSFCRYCLPDQRRSAQPGGRPGDLRQRAGRRPLGGQAHSYARSISCGWRPNANGAGHWRCCGSTAMTKPPPRWRGCARRWNERGSLEHGRRLAWQYCERALAADSQPLTFFEDNEDRRFLREMLLYVVERVK